VRDEVRAAERLYAFYTGPGCVRRVSFPCSVWGRDIPDSCWGTGEVVEMFRSGCRGQWMVKIKVVSVYAGGFRADSQRQAEEWMSEHIVDKPAYYVYRKEGFVAKLTY